MRILSSSLLFAAVLLASCGGSKQVGVITQPTSASTNLEGHEYPKINPDLSATFRNDFPDAKTVTVNVGGKNYPLVKGDDGMWEVTTDPVSAYRTPTVRSSLAQTIGRAVLTYLRPVWIITWRRRSRTARSRS